MLEKVKNFCILPNFPECWTHTNRQLHTHKQLQINIRRKNINSLSTIFLIPSFNQHHIASSESRNVGGGHITTTNIPRDTTAESMVYKLSPGPRGQTDTDNPAEYGFRRN